MNIEIITISFVCLIIVKILNHNMSEKKQIRNINLSPQSENTVSDIDIDYDLKVESKNNKQLLTKKSNCEINFISIKIYKIFQIKLK